MSSEHAAWLFLNRVPLLGPVRFHQLLERWPSAEAILKLSGAELKAAGISEDLARCWSAAFGDRKIAKQVEDEIGRAERGEFQIVTEEDESYPSALVNFSDRPPVLFVRGKWPLPTVPAVALVGTRRMTPYGEDVARNLSRELVQRGLTTVSGLAAGIDAVVHQTTLEESGHTVAVLGHGFQFMYPRSNERIYKEVLMRGTLVSEYPSDCPPSAGQFPRRNRIIAGLSRAVVVVEAPIKSGALITARYAAEQGREVLAVPGSIYQAQSSGCNLLIQQGAKAVLQADDVLESLGIRVTPSTRTSSVAARQSGAIESLNAFEKRLLVSLEDGPVSVDDLVRLLQASVDRLANALLSLELKGLVTSLPGQLYARTHS